MYYAVYAEINLICAAILIYILYKLSSTDKSSETRALTSVLGSTIVILLLDTAWTFIESKPALVPQNYAVSGLYLFDTCLISYFWLLYIELRLKNTAILKKNVMALLALPLMVPGVLCVAAPFFGGIFYIDANNLYHRGSLYFLQIATAYSYIVAATLHMCFRLARTTNKWERDMYLTLVSFLLLPLAGGILSIVFYGLPLVWPATTMSLLMIFVNLQAFQISVDQLTGLNNRRSFDRYLAERLSDDEGFCLMMMDINKFKRINDTYGHVEGDRALKESGQVLRDVCGSRESFLARFGGDEFCVILKNAGLPAAEQLAAEIHQAFDARNDKPGVTFTLTVSIGIAENWPGSRAETLIAAADKKLYAAKELAGLCGDAGR